MRFIVKWFDFLSATNAAVDEDDDITKCCKCRQLLTDPRTLPCLDSLCDKCFREVCNAHKVNPAGVATCPSCGDQCHLPTNDLQSAPDRGFIDTLVALKMISSQDLEDDNCDICRQLTADSGNVPAAEYYCIECRQRMCAEDARRHPLCPFTKNHNIVGLGLASAKRMCDVWKSFFPACANHRDQYATVHCYQCSIELCSQCQNLHAIASHRLEMLTDQTHSQLTDRVKTLSDELCQQFDAWKRDAGRVQKLLSDTRNGVGLAEKEITNKAKEITSLIEIQRDDLLSALHSRNDQTISNLDAVSAILSSGVSANKKALRFARELLDKGSVEDMLLNYRMLHNRVTRLHDMSLPVGSSASVDSDSNDVSPASLIRDVCASLNSQSKSISLTIP